MDIPLTDDRRTLDGIVYVISECRSRRDVPPFLARKGLRLHKSRFAQVGRCHTYIFGQEKWYKKMSEQDIDKCLLGQGILFLGEKYRSVGCPVEGAIAVYFWKSQFPAALHFGRVVQNSHIRSKWGDGHVYEHRWDVVPTEYGDCVTFFKKLSRQ